MTDRLDLKLLATRESEQVEWKENVADPDNLVATVSAFANDWPNLGGGYVVCGARETKDQHGFPSLELIGLTANRLKEIEGKVLAACRDRVDPPLSPLVQELPSSTPDRRILVFVVPATRSAHLFRAQGEAGKYYVRIGRETREARNGILRELLVRKGAREEWDRRPCETATTNDLDLLALRDSLQRMNVFHSDQSVEEYLSDTKQLSPFVPPLCFRESLTNIVRPRNFALLLYGRNLQRHIPGAISLFSIYAGTDRSEPHAERHELAGTLVDQARTLIQLLDVQSYVAFDKTDKAAPNAIKYPPQALHEALINALVHRDYESPDPTRVTVFADRIEILSPGSLPFGIALEELRDGKAPPKWRNQSLAWFLNRLQLAQAEGQGVPTILRSMRDEGCPPPSFDANDTRVTCQLPAHPRHRLARQHRAIEEMLSIGEFERARVAVAALLKEDSSNTRTLQIFAEVHRALAAPEPVKRLISELGQNIDRLPLGVLTGLADVLAHSPDPPKENLSIANRLYLAASRGKLAERQIQSVALGLSMSRDSAATMKFIDDQFAEHPDLKDNAYLLRLRGNALIGLARKCIDTGRSRQLPAQTRTRAWKESRRYLDRAESDLRRASSHTTDSGLQQQIGTNLAFLEDLRRRATPPGRRVRT